MGLLERARHILASNLNAILEKAEDPLKVLKKTILDMEEALRELLRFRTEILAEREYLKARVVENEASQARWEERAELALAEGEEDLARKALEEKHLLSSERKTLEASIEECSRGAEEIGRQIDGLRLKIVEAKGKRAELLRAIVTQRLIRLAPSAGTLEADSTEAALRHLEVERDLERLKNKKPDTPQSNRG